MTEDDLGFVQTLVAHNVIGRSVLELGGRHPTQTCRSRIEGSGRSYVATDLRADRGVEFVADFEIGMGVSAIAAAGPFGTVLVLNVLQHCFNPVTVLDNVLHVTAPGREGRNRYPSSMAFAQLPDGLLSPAPGLVPPLRYFTCRWTRR